MLRSILCTGVLILLPVSGFSQGQKNAVVIGVQNYEDPNIRDLKYCENDAKGLHAALTDPETCNFGDRNVTLLHSGLKNNFSMPTLENVTTELKTTLRRARAEDTILIYFSCHGVIDAKTKKGYLILQDTKSDKLAETALPIDELIKWLSSTSAKHRLLILDCCQSGYEGKRLFVEQTNYIQPGAETLVKPVQKLQSANVVTLASCQSNEYSYEWNKAEMGYFTYFLVQALNSGDADVGGDGLVDSTELFSYVKDKVRQQVTTDKREKQEPTQVLSGSGKVPSIPLARATFEPFKLSMKGKNGLPPKDCKGQLFLNNGTLHIDTRGIPLDRGFIKAHDYLLTLPEEVTIRKNFIIEFGFNFKSTGKNAALLRLTPSKGRPWAIVIHAVDGVSVIDPRGVSQHKKNVLSGKEEHTLVVNRILTKNGATMAIQVNGQSIPLRSEMSAGPIPKIEIGLHHNGRRTPQRPQIRSFEVRPN